MSADLNLGFVPGRHVLDAVGNGGFRFADMSHRGSILILPSGIHAWDAKIPGDLTTGAFSLVFAEAGLIDFLLIGTGVNPAFIDDAVGWRFREANIGVYTMTTVAAARTYNVLANEGRRVGAALLAVD
jgi:uncharacterized protein